MQQISFETKAKYALVSTRTDTSGATYYHVCITDKDKQKVSQHHLKSMDGVKSLTALLRVCKDPNNHFCPLPVRCTKGVKHLAQHGGNPSLPPVSLSLKSTAGGNLLYQAHFKNNKIRFLKNAGFVLAVITIGFDKYHYPMSFDSFYLIKSIDDDCFKRFGYRLGLKRYIKLCKKYAYDRENLNAGTA